MAYPTITAPNYSSAVINNATGAAAFGLDVNAVTIWTPGASGGRVYGIIANTTDTKPVFINIFLVDSAKAQPILALFQVLLTYNFGDASKSYVQDLFSLVAGSLPLDPQGKPYLDVNTTSVVKASVLSPVTTGQRLILSAIGANY